MEESALQMFVSSGDSNLLLLCICSERNLRLGAERARGKGQKQEEQRVQLWSHSRCASRIICYPNPFSRRNVGLDLRMNLYRSEENVRGVRCSLSTRARKLTGEGMLVQGHFSGRCRMMNVLNRIDEEG